MSEKCQKPTPVPHSESAGERWVRVFKGAHRLLRIPGLLDQRFRVPLAPLGSEKIAAVNMKSTGQARDRIGHRMDDVAPEQLGISLAQRFCARRLDLVAVTPRYSTPKDVVHA